MDCAQVYNFKNWPLQNAPGTHIKNMHSFPWREGGGIFSGYFLYDSCSFNKKIEPWNNLTLIFFLCFETPLYMVQNPFFVSPNLQFFAPWLLRLGPPSALPCPFLVLLYKYNFYTNNKFPYGLTQSLRCGDHRQCNCCKTPKISRQMLREFLNFWGSISSLLEQHSTFGFQKQFFGNDY